MRSPSRGARTPTRESGIASTVIEDLKGLARLRLDGIPEIDPPTASFSA